MKTQTETQTETEAIFYHVCINLTRNIVIKYGENYFPVKAFLPTSIIFKRSFNVFILKFVARACCPVFDKMFAS